MQNLAVNERCMEKGIKHLQFAITLQQSVEVQLAQKPIKLPSALAASILIIAPSIEMDLLGYCCVAWKGVEWCGWHKMVGNSVGGMEWCGMVWSGVGGMEWCGVVWAAWNGVEWCGMVWVAWNGVEWCGWHKWCGMV